MPSQEINAQAFDWVVKLQRGLNQEEQSLLDRWLALDARCVGALARAQAYWVHVDAVRNFSDTQKLRLRSTVPAYPAIAWAGRRQPRSSWPSVSWLYGRPRIPQKR